MLSSDNMFFTALTPMQRVSVKARRRSRVASSSYPLICRSLSLLQLLHRTLRVHSYASCMLLLAMPPLPVAAPSAHSEDTDLQYLDMLVQLVDRLPPSFIIHAHSNVIATDL